MVSVHQALTEDPPWRPSLPCSPITPALAETFSLVLQDSSASLAARKLLNGICCLVRALPDLPMDSGTLFPSLGLRHL